MLFFIFIFWFIFFFFFKQNLIKTFISLEILFLSCIFWYVYITILSFNLVNLSIFCLILFGLLSCETAIALCLIIYIFRLRGIIWLDNIMYKVKYLKKKIKGMLNFFRKCFKSVCFFFKKFVQKLNQPVYFYYIVMELRNQIKNYFNNFVKGTKKYSNFLLFLKNFLEFIENIVFLYAFYFFFNHFYLFYYICNFNNLFFF